MKDRTRKIFTNKAIIVATFFGGPLAAGFLISRNYKAFENDDAARNSVFIGILSTILLFAGIFMIPEHIFEKIPQALFPGIYTAIIAWLVEKLQGKKIKEFLESNGQKASNWQATGYGLSGMTIIIGTILVFIFVIPNKGYEKSTIIDTNVKLYYSKNFDESKSIQIAELIKQSGFMDGSEGADLLLSDEDNIYKLKFIIPDTTVLNDTLFLSDFNGFENYLNYNLNYNNKIQIEFTDINLQKVFELKEITINTQNVYGPILYLSQYQINEYHNIFYNSTMPLTEVMKVEDAIKRLKEYFPANQAIDIVFLNSETDYTLKFFVAKDLWHFPGVTNRLRSTVDYIKKNGIKKHINLVLIDNQTFEEIQL